MKILLLAFARHLAANLCHLPIQDADVRAEAASGCYNCSAFEDEVHHCGLLVKKSSLTSVLSTEIVYMLPHMARRSAKTGLIPKHGFCEIGETMRLLHCTNGCAR